MEARSLARAATPLSIAPRAEHEHYQALDGLRGLAILLVFIIHIYGTADHFKTSWVGSIVALDRKSVV